MIADKSPVLRLHGVGSRFSGERAIVAEDMLGNGREALGATRAIIAGEPGRSAVGRPDETSGKPYGVPTEATPGSTDVRYGSGIGMVWCGPEADG